MPIPKPNDGNMHITMTADLRPFVAALRAAGDKLNAFANACGIEIDQVEVEREANANTQT